MLDLKFVRENLDVVKTMLKNRHNPLSLDEFEKLETLPDDISDEEMDEFDGVWFYRYSENPDDPNEEPEISMIEDDDEFEAVIDADDEFLDEMEFEEA